MFKLPFSKKDSNTNKFLTIELNSQTVKAATFYVDENSYKIIGLGEGDLERGSVRSGKIINMADTIEATEEAISKACENTEEFVNNVIVGVSSDMCIEQVTTAKIKRGNKNNLSQKEISHHIERVKASALDQAHINFFETKGNDKTELELITESVVYTKVDGAKITKYEETEAEELEIALYTAHCPKYYIDSINKLTKKVKLNLLALVPINFSIQNALEKTDMESSDYITLHIDSDYTNVGVAFGTSVVTTKSLPIGLEHFVESISGNMGLTYKEAEKVLETHKNENLNKSESMIVQNCLEDTLEIWLNGIKILFGSAKNIKTFPSIIYMLGTGSELSEISELLDRPWTKSIPFKEPPSFEILSPNVFEGIVDSTGMLNAPKWTSTISLCYMKENLP